MATGMFSITSYPPSQTRFPPMRNNLPTMGGSSTTKTASMAGLANYAILAAIDKLRELSVGAVIPLPQLVVVGDQSSGKSSVLESLTGFSFPRAAGLCTRYATQITCCREPESSIHISIIPRPDAGDALKERLVEFQRRVASLDDATLAGVFEEANRAMGIRMDPTDTDTSLSAFSEDILRVQINGPTEEHLTVIDVPGIFRVPTPGLTTESDIQLVENMVKTYMNNSRTIILAVLPCTADIATQETLKLAEAADTSGVRTMAVLTKPDLAMEVATRMAVVDIVLGSNSLKLGHYVVKNRGADDTTSTISERDNNERAFFSGPDWSAIRDRCGIANLKIRLHELLVQTSNWEFPHVRADIEARLSRSREKLKAMGPSRGEQGSQRRYLGKLAARFQEVEPNPDLRLVTKIIRLNEAFSDTVWKRGHARLVHPTRSNEGRGGDDGKDYGKGQEVEGDGGDESAFTQVSEAMPFDIPLRKHPELSGIIRPEGYDCPEPEEDSVLGLIREVYEENRGPELGTFGGTILALVFEEQSKKWEPLVLSHTSDAIALVHEFIHQLFIQVCPEEQVRKNLWDTLLVHKLCEAYRRAMGHAHFLLEIERGAKPVTYNHYFNSTLQRKRAERVKSMYEDLITINKSRQTFVPFESIGQRAANKDNSQQVCEDILDSLDSYYKVARKRFVDVVCQHVVHHYLLEGAQSPLHIFGPDLIMGLSPEQLEAIAGEDAETNRQRQVLEREVERLEAAAKVIGG